MRRIGSKLSQLTRLLGRGDFAGILEWLRRRLWSDATYYGYVVSGQALPTVLPTKLQFTLRPMTDADVAEVFSLDGLSPEDRREVDSRRKFYEAGFRQAYVGVSDTNEIVYLGWIIDGTTQRNHLLEYFLGTFPPLESDEMLIENSWIPPKARGKGIMPPALNMLAHEGATPDTGRIYTFVENTNTPSTIGVLRSGMAPYITRVERWRLFRQQIQWLSPPPLEQLPQVAIPTAVAVCSTCFAESEV